MSDIELPAKYYHDNFEFLLDFVKERYADILKLKEWRFLRKYYTLPEEAQCLFIRFANRKGLFFKTKGLSYDEITKIPENLELLSERGFISSVNPIDHQPWVNEILSVLTKTELIKFFDLNELKTAKKAEVSEFVLENYKPEQILTVISKESDIIKLNFESEVAFLMFLFFGNRSMDMTEFVLRDLGLNQYYKMEEDNLVARFSSRKEAEDKWLVSDLFLLFSELKKSVSAIEIYDWYKNFNDLHSDLSESVIPSYKKFQVLIGRHLERNKHLDLAIEVFRAVEIPPARERMVRCLVKNKDLEEARTLCRLILDDPYSIDEKYFAEDFLKSLSGKKTRKKTTEFLKQAETITLSDIYHYQVELGSIEYFNELGFNAGFSENFPWRALFGLTFWEIIFDPTLMSFHHPFQRRPSDLYLPDFYLKRSTQLHEKLASITDSDQWIAYLWDQFSKYKDIVNPFILWEPEIWELLRVLVERIALDSLKKILMLMAENIVENSRGFPDLLVWSEESFELVEIKSPNDTLSNQQLYWLEIFKELGVSARVLRVQFRE